MRAENYGNIRDKILKNQYKPSHDYEILKTAESINTAKDYNLAHNFSKILKDHLSDTTALGGYRYSPSSLIAIIPCKFPLIVTEEVKDMAVTSILKYYNRGMYFSGPEKRIVYRFMISRVKPGDEKILEVFDKFSRTLSITDLKHIINNHIPYLKPDLQKEINEAIKKMPLYQLMSIDVSSVSTNQKERIKLLKLFSKTPTMIKKIKTKVHFSEEDILALPPVGRFNFIRNYYGYEVRSMKYYYNRTKDEMTKQVSKSKVRTGLYMLDLPNFDVEKMKELLFTVGIKKNKQLTSFIDGYEKYKNFTNQVEESKDEQG